MSKTLYDIQNLYRKYVRCATLMIALLVTALIMAFINQLFILPVLTVSLIFHLGILRPLQKQYIQSITQANLEQTVCRIINASHPVLEKASGAITPELILKSELMPCRISSNSPLLRWQISGEKNGFEISLCDTAIAEEFRLKENGKTRIHFNSGVWSHIELPFSCRKRFFILDDTSVPTPIRMEHFKGLSAYENQTMQDRELAEHTALYCPRNEPSAAPSAAFLHEFKRLKGYTPGYIAVSVSSQTMDVFIRGRFLSRAVSMSKKPDENILNFNPFPELSYLIRLASTLRE